MGTRKVRANQTKNVYVVAVRTMTNQHVQFFVTIAVKKNLSKQNL